jgi:hypothetical protein
MDEKVDPSADSEILGASVDGEIVGTSLGAGEDNEGSGLGLDGIRLRCSDDVAGIEEGVCVGS